MEIDEIKKTLEWGWEGAIYFSDTENMWTPNCYIGRISGFYDEGVKVPGILRSKKIPYAHIVDLIAPQSTEKISVLLEEGHIVNINLSRGHRNKMDGQVAYKTDQGIVLVQVKDKFLREGRVPKYTFIPFDEIKVARVIHKTSLPPEHKGGAKRYLEKRSS